MRGRERHRDLRGDLVELAQPKRRLVLPGHWTRMCPGWLSILVARIRSTSLVLSRISLSSTVVRLCGGLDDEDTGSFLLLEAQGSACTANLGRPMYG
jgi:hypothetical protein